MSDNQSNKREQYFFRASSSDFKKVPGTPIAYDMPVVLISEFEKDNLLRRHVDAKSGQNTGDNGKFVRFWFEPNYLKIGFGVKQLEDTHLESPKWYPYNKGGEFRKWYGNFDNVVNWAGNGRDIKAYAVVRNNGGHWSRYIQNLEYMLREGITWTFISSSYFGARYTPPGHIFDYAGCSAFPKSGSIKKYLGFFCSGVAQYILKFMNPTLNLQPGNVGTLPDPCIQDISALEKDVESLIALSKKYWDSMERSWNFLKNPLFEVGVFDRQLKIAYNKLHAQWLMDFSDAAELERRNKKRFIDAFNLHDAVPSDVSSAEITLECNPHYRYGCDKTEEELEALLLADTMREFISYAVGCMFGRYALDKPGLVLANQGETIEDYRRLVPNSRFEADADNVIPMLDGEWFADDVTERFRQFLRVTFGDEHYDENLAFIEQALNVKGKRNYTLRDYMLGEFYTDHVKRYKKRPIYWLFSSPKGTFNALIYLHRYRPDTASVVLQYLREFRAKLAARQSTLEQVLINPATSQAEKTRANKEIDTLKKQLIELQDYENDTLYPLATAQVAIDLDDGVKVNYLKLGAALKKIAGLDAKDED